MQPTLMINPAIVFDETVRLVATINGGSSAYVKFRAFTCGPKNVIVTEANSYPDSPYLREDIDSDYFSFNKFTTNETNCPIAKYHLTARSYDRELVPNSVVYPNALTCEGSNCTIKDNNVYNLTFNIYMEANGGAYIYS